MKQLESLVPTAVAVSSVGAVVSGTALIAIRGTSPTVNQLPPTSVLWRRLLAMLQSLSPLPSSPSDPVVEISYLALPAVSCVGGSWVTPGELTAKRAWGELTEHAARFSRGAAGGK